ncbi:helix-turn-helix domain-containing protein [Achromobacter sp. 413638]|uniref:helix-turn-helix domain-containing protein n=1 Tax=Achromobacter sp. 413638 TaxID=3342385 RepID=UPI00370C05D6
MNQMAISARIKERRKQLRLTQEQLADLANLTQAAIAKIERGGATRHIAEIAKALSVTTNWLVYGEESKSLDQLEGYWPFKVARLADFEALSPAKRNELDLRLADFIAGAMETKRTA